jgi:hypothetical protein
MHVILTPGLVEIIACDFVRRVAAVHRPTKPTHPSPCGRYTTHKLHMGKLVAATL